MSLKYLLHLCSKKSLRGRTRWAAILLAGIGLFTTSLGAVYAQTPTAKRPVHPQSTMSVGAGSYASEPPYPDSLHYDFDYTTPLYLGRAAKQQHLPVPTNDWWTDLLMNGKNGGVMWVYPLVLDPDPQGFNLNFPNSIDVAPLDSHKHGGGYNMHYGGNMRLTAAGYKPSAALAESWTDWGLVMSLPDTTSDPTTTKNMTVTTAHGVPFAWVETQGVNPQLGFEKPATFLAADGSPLQFPATQSFVVSTDNRYFGVHLAPGSVLTCDTAHFATIDLGKKYPLSEVKLYWENAYAKNYSLQVSDDGLSWQTIYQVANYTKPANGLADLILTGQGYAGRYLKLVMTRRATQYGYSLFEMQAFDNTGALVSQGRPVAVSSVENPALVAANLNDGNLTTTRWAATNLQTPSVVMQTGAGASYFVVSALQASSDQEAGARLATYEAYAYNKVSDTQVHYAYDATAGKVQVSWNLTTTNLKGGPAGPTLQGFLPHLYQNTTNSVAFSPYTYVSPRGALKTAIGMSFTFTYDFNGVIPSYNAPFRNPNDAHPYDAQKLFDLVTAYAANPSNGGDTYFGGKDLVQHMKFALLARELNHQAYPALKEKARAAIVDWLTFSPGETKGRYFASYNRWGALIGFGPSYYSDQFTDNHFHYGYFTLACALYNMLDPTFLSQSQYGGMARKIAKQYANWDKTDLNFPWMRTFDPWMGHSYAGGLSSGNGNNQESSSEAMQSWIGLFLLGDALGDADMRAAGAFGYSSESAASLEYWFDWKHRNFPPAYAAERHMGAIVSNQGLGHSTFFDGDEQFVHGIEYLPLNPGLNYLARDTAWAQGEYRDLLREAVAAPRVDNNTGAVIKTYTDELDFGADWTHVVLGLKFMSDPQYVTALMDANYQLNHTSPRYIMSDKEVAGMTYFYAHAQQNLGYFSSKFHTNVPASNVFERNGKFTYATAYNATNNPQTATVYDTQGNVVYDAQGNVASAVIPAHTLKTFPTPPTTGTAPTGCYSLLPLAVKASTGNGAAAADGDPGSRWESAFADPQQLTIDYGSVAAINTVTIAWENASASTYQLQGSVDSVTWTTIKAMGPFPAINKGLGVNPNRTDVISVGGNYRYLRMAGMTRTTPYGYSIYELTACGTATTATGTGPLPVTLLDFSAQAQTTSVGLTWHTASEQNSDHFEVERSLDGVHFTMLSRVAARGVSPAATAYAHRDTALPAGATQLYYRLRQVDADGRATYSPVRTISLSKAGGLTLFPNPAHTTATLVGAAPDSAVQLLDALGRLVTNATTDAAGTATLALPAGLPNGVYIVRTGVQALRLLVR